MKEIRKNQRGENDKWICEKEKRDIKADKLDGEDNIE